MPYLNEIGELADPDPYGYHQAESLLPDMPGTKYYQGPTWDELLRLAGRRLSTEPPF